MGLAGEVWNATKVCTKFGWGAGKFIIKNTPMALGMMWTIKKEISEEIVLEYQEYQKEKKIEELNTKILQLSHKKDL